MTVSSGPTLPTVPGERESRTSRRWFGVRVPVIRQMTITDCGAACLGMVLSFHGRKVRMHELRTAVGAGRDGTSALSLMEAASSYGLSVDPVGIGAQDLMGLEEPAILHWQSNHYVVLERIGRNGAVIVDPMLGRRRLTLQAFEEGFSGIAFLITPGTSFSAQTLKRARWSRYWKILRRAHSESVRVLLGSIALQLIGLAVPAATALVIDKVIPSGQHSLLTLVILGALCFGVLHLAVSYFRAFALLRLQTLLDREMTTGFVSHILSLPFSFFQNRTLGGVFAFLNSIVIIRDVLSTQFVSMALDAAMVSGYFLLLLKIRPVFAVVALGTGLLQALTVLLTKERIHVATQDQVHSQSRAQGLIIEILRGIETIKSAGLETTTFDNWRALHWKQAEMTMKRELIGEGVRILLASLTAVSPIVFLALGAGAVLDRQLSLGAMLALIALAAGFLTPLSSLLGSLNKTQVVGAHLDRIDDVYEEIPERTSGEEINDFDGRIDFRQVSFRYAPNSPLVLRNLSFSIERNSTVALVGPSGSGKSTVAKLILGLYTLTEGQIFVDGRPIEEIDLRNFRKHIGVVTQAMFLFNDTVTRNIAFDQPGMSPDVIVRAAEMASIHADILAMPLGYDTVIGEGGGGLSGGQRQRICLARALARRPRMLLFDEATSELDVLSERAVQSALDTLDVTRILIAHRVSTIQSADQILVLSGGEIIERGTHDELMAGRGLYNEMVSGSSATVGVSLAH